MRWIIPETISIILYQPKEWKIFLPPKAKAPVILSYEDLIVVGLPVIQTEIFH